MDDQPRNPTPLAMPTEVDSTVRELTVHLATLGNERVRADPFVAETLRDLKHVRRTSPSACLDEPSVAWHQPPTMTVWGTAMPEDGGPVWRQYGTCWRCADLDEPEVPQPLSFLWVAKGGDVVELGFCAACRADLERFEPAWREVPGASV